MQQPLKGRIAAVTGAANGIGRAGARHLAHLGADIAAIDLDGAGLDALVREIGETGRRVLTVSGDCRDEGTLADFVADAGARFGGIDILINNVGQSARERAGDFLDSEEETWRFVVDVSLFSALRATRLIAPGMKARGWGRVINVSSDAALVGDAGLADYAAAKSGLIGFTRALARELAPHRVTVNAVCFGTVRTRAHDRLAPDVLESVKRRVPMGYIAEAENATRIIGFLAGPGGDYVTGQSIAVNGGRWFL